MLIAIADCNFADCNFADCNFTDCNFADCNFADRRSAASTASKLNFVQPVMLQRKGVGVYLRGSKVASDLL